MKEKIKIDIVSDVVCPWCIIGYENLKKAIHELGLSDQVEIEWQPFELNPDMPEEGEELKAHTARKYGSSPESSNQFRIEMTERGKEVGFNFNFFEGMKIVNTRQAHVLLEYAKSFNLQTELKLRLFKAFFTDKKNISARSVLAEEVAAIGLDAKQAMALLDDVNSFNDIKTAELTWQGAGISSVPTIVFNRESALSGAQPVDTFKQVLANLNR